jgi:23S rRNA-/tRNA-specific pseudouridylate synthase
VLRQFEQRKVRKLYAAVVVGALQTTELLIERKIGPKPGSPGLSAVGVRLSSRAETLVRVRERLGRHTFVEAEPRTGRLHQIRVHLQSIGCPVLADPDYGDGKPLLLSELKPGYKPGRAQEKPLIARPALHAECLNVISPATGQAVTIRAPWPKDFELALKYLRKFAA